MEKKRSHIILAGAAPDTGNHGVSALSLSALKGLADRGLEAATILDNGGNKTFESELPLATQTLAFKPGKRIYQASNMHQVRLRQLFGLPSPLLEAIRHADALLDVSGGDSFTDIYGPARFEQVLMPKLMAVDVGTPLILLPQTYGPFLFKRSRQLARKVILASKLVYARDIDSFNNLKDLLGDDFDAQKHRLGVDLAFGLPVIRVNPKQYSVGLNVSGLLWNNPEGAKKQFDLTCNYQAVLKGFCKALFEAGTQNILLVPHVRPSGGSECDLVAARALKAALPSYLSDRISIETDANSPEALKGIIAETEWFAGSRMHATIAALSSGIPSCNLA
ncbi:MAG: polysaccharide pyruvyl transferase family protein, partial [Kordiimonas sp.]